MSMKRAEFIGGLAEELGMTKTAALGVWEDLSRAIIDQGQGAVFGQEIEEQGAFAGWKVGRTVAEAIERMDNPAAEVICRFAQLATYQD
jgi:hypothetical protein